MKISKQNRNTLNRERGIALIAALLALLLIGAVTGCMIVLSSTETSISSNFRDEQLAFFSAKAGIEEARDRMRVAATNSINVAGTLPTTLPGTTGSVVYILNPANGETVAPWKGSSLTSYPDTEICNETSTVSCTNSLPNLTTCSGWCRSVTASSTYAASPVFDWKWTRVTLKQNNALTSYPTNGSSASALKVCWNGTNEETTSCTAPNTPVYVLTSLAVTPSGSRRMVQTEIAEDRLNFNAAAALTMDGTGDVFSGPSGNNFGVSGADTAGCGGAATAATIPSVGVIDAPDIVTVTAGIPNNRKTHYTGSGGLQPDVENISASLQSSLQTVSSLQTLVSTIKNDVTQPVINGPSSNIASPGTLAAPQIIYVNGDLSLAGNTTGYGILVVTGTLTVSGNIGWNGLVLVIGKGIFSGNGGGNGSYNGAIVIAKTLDVSGNTLSALGAPTFTFGGGGDNGVNYSSGCIAQATTLTTFHVNVIRELVN